MQRCSLAVVWPGRSVAAGRFDVAASRGPSGSSRGRSRCRHSCGQVVWRPRPWFRCPGTGRAPGRRAVRRRAGRFLPVSREKPRSGPRGIWITRSTRPFVCFARGDGTPDPNARRAGWIVRRSFPARAFRRADGSAAGRPHAAPRRERHVGLANGVRVIMVVARLGEEEHVFMIGGGTRLHGRGHRVGLVPNHITAEDPARVDQCQGDAPRESQLAAVEIFVSEDQP